MLIYTAWQADPVILVEIKKEMESQGRRLSKNILD